MPLEIAVPLAAFLVFFLGCIAFGRGRREPAPEPEEAAAKRFIEARIDEHVELLAEKYLETRPSVAEPDGSGEDRDPRERQDAEVDDDVSRRFASEIEAFIADVVLEDEALSALDDVELKSAIREVVVLDRQYVYDQVLARIRGHIGRLDDRG
jgi:hypothetical protein